MRKKYKLISLILMSFFFVACNDDDDKIVPTPDQKPVSVVEVDPDAISKFIWGGLDTWYLWEADVDALALGENSEEWKKYLNAYKKDYEGLFESLLHRVPDAKGRPTVDRWSWFIDDWRKQEESFAGIGKSFGFEYLLTRYGENKVLGYVTYILPSSPASKTDLKRGDIFYKINGEEITVDNYRDLLFENDTYKLNFFDYSEKGLAPNSKEVTATAIEGFKENPILMAKKIEGTNVGYLVYNSFTGGEDSEFNLALNDSIGKLKNEGITDFVLDLRYNGGGATYTAKLLASMIYGGHTDKIFNTSKYNKAIDAYFRAKKGDDYFNDYFADKIVDRSDKVIATLNSLNLNRLYVLVSEHSASSSELIINGLRPYIDVVLVGTTTHGKYVSSITVKDYLKNGSVNSAHSYAMQPIVAKSANANGVTDYGRGFKPNYVRNEWDYLGKMKPLGNKDEPLLKAALGVIAGDAVPVELVAKTKGTCRLKTLFDSKDIRPFSKEMYNDRMVVNLNELRK